MLFERLGAQFAANPQGCAGDAFRMTVGQRAVGAEFFRFTAEGEQLFITFIIGIDGGDEFAERRAVVDEKQLINGAEAIDERGDTAERLNLEMVFGRGVFAFGAFNGPTVDAVPKHQ